MKNIFITSFLLGCALLASAQNNPNAPSQVQSTSSGLDQPEKMIMPAPVVTDSVSSSSGSVNKQGHHAPAPVKQDLPPVDKKNPALKKEVDSVPAPK
jgi:hypothetical protein